jgi:hypothetical protein
MSIKTLISQYSFCVERGGRGSEKVMRTPRNVLAHVSQTEKRFHLLRGRINEASSRNHQVFCSISYANRRTFGGERSWVE